MMKSYHKSFYYLRIIVQFGKKLNKIRKAGFVPANIFGPDFKSKSISVVYKDLVLKGLKLLKQWLQVLALELFWESELQDIVKLCRGNVAIVISVDLFDCPHNRC